MDLSLQHITLVVSISISISKYTLYSLTLKSGPSWGPFGYFLFNPLFGDTWDNISLFQLLSLMQANIPSMNGALLTTKRSAYSTIWALSHPEVVEITFIVSRVSISSLIWKFYLMCLHFYISNVVSIKFSPLCTIDLANNWYQLHNGDYG